MLMKRNAYLLLFLGLGTSFSLQAQEAPAPETPPSAWTIGAGIGLDFSQLLQINPKQGAGQNRFGLGGATTLFAKLNNSRRVNWDNTVVWQFAVQKVGSGPLANGEPLPFQKAIDEFRLSSKFGYRTADTSKFFYAVDVNLLSQITPTFQGTTQYPGNFLSDITNTNATPLSRFFSPATLNLSVGIDFKPSKKLSVFYSPVGAKFVIVSNDDIARQGVHGNPVTKNANGAVIDFENVDAQIGSLLKANYANKFLTDKLTFTSQLLLYSNYLRNPQNIDVDWNNQFAFTIAKGLQLAVTMNVFYDDDVRVQITDNDAPGGVSGTGKRVSFTQQMLIKYGINL